jgi:hypothetical protein
MRRGLALACILVIATACGSNSGGDNNEPPTNNPNPNQPTPPAPPASTNILVSGSDMGPLYQNLSLSRNNEAVRGAEVRVNGTVIPETATPGFYQGVLPEMIQPGGQLTLEVRAGSDAVTGVTSVPMAPTLITPADGGTVTRGTPTPFSWSSPNNPSEFMMGISYVVNNGGTGQHIFVAGDARNGTVPTSAIPAGATNVRGYVFAYGNGTFTGPVDPASRLRVRQPSGEVALILN